MAISVLLDATGAHTGYLATLLSRLPIGSLKAFPADVLLFPSQAEREGVPLPDGLRKIEVISPATVPDLVLEWAGKHGSEEQILIGSYRPEILELQYRPPLANRPNTEIHSVGKFLSRYSDLSGAPTAGVVWNEHILPQDMAIETLVRALNSNGGQLKKTQLRPRLERENPVFRKSNPLTGDPRTISALVALAESRGVISVANNEHNDPVISVATSAIRDQMPSGGERFGASSLALAGSQVAMSNSIPKTYSERFTEALEKIRMGPFANLRPIFYKALERRVQESLSVDSLISRCVTDVRAAYVESGGSVAHLPWPVVRRFFEKLLIRAKILRGEGDALLYPCFAHAGLKVQALVSNYVTELEGALVLFLIDEVGQIEYADVPAVTGSLYLTRADNDRHQLLEVLSFLSHSGKLMLEDDHYRPAK